MINNLTVLMPAYNSAKFIAPAIKSILIQSFKNYELLIIDDGSDDNIAEIVSSFKDQRINFIRKKHEGLSVALNYGLKIASSEWVARMDADDLSHPERLKKEIELVKNKEDLVFCLSAFFKKGRILFTHTSPEKEVKKSLALHSYFTHASVIYNKHFILENNGYNEALQSFEDYDLWLRLMNKANYKMVNEYLYFTRFRKKSLTRNIKNRNEQIIYNIQTPYYSDLNKSFGITYREEIIKYNGWREYFFGNKKSARKYFRELNKKDYRIKLAFLLTYFPRKIIDRFITFSLRPRFQYYFNKLSGEYTIDKELKITLKNIEEQKII